MKIKRNKSLYWNWLMLILWVAILIMVLFLSKAKKVEASYNPFISAANIETQALQVFGTGENPAYEEVDANEKKVDSIIREVFGSHYPKAMKLLKGTGKGSCAENRTLNPKALNDNTEWGGRGKDWGVFQINDSWQQVHNVRFLQDPEINVRIAWRIYEDSGYSFKLWTCGKVYKI